MKAASWISGVAGAALFAGLAVACATTVSGDRKGDGLPPAADVHVGFVSWDLADTPLDRTADQLEATTHDHLARARELHQAVLEVTGPRTVANTLEPLNELYMHLDAASQECNLFAEVHPDEAVRDTARSMTQELSSYWTELSLDRGVYDALAAIDASNATPDTRWALEKELRDYRRAGVDQSDDVRKQIAALNDAIVSLGQTFDKNLAEDVREVRFDPSVLEGLPEDFIAGHPVQDDGQVVIDTTYPDYIPFMRYAENPAARRKLYMTYMNRGYPQNMQVLQDLVAKRDEKAHLLGYANWAAYATEDKMVGTPRNAADFIDKVHAVSEKAAARDYAMLLERKRQDDPGATEVLDWEKYYLANKVRTERFDFDAQVMRPYFDFDDVRQGVFDVTSRMFGVRYVPVEGLQLWHKGVTAWDVYDGETRLGRFYLDLFPRPDKYGHAACFGYREGVEGERLPQACLVCNFPDPARSPDGTALMEFSQVETFFHEFGHLLHGIFGGHQRWMTNSGISTEMDFVEAPSQMLEEWLHDPETLQLFAHHYKTGAPVPAELVERMRAADEFGKGMDTAHQSFYAMLSLSCYDRPVDQLDTDALVDTLQVEYSPFDHVPGTHFQCGFGHLNGYSAMYYTYLWSQVIAKDMFSRFTEEGPLNPATARRYRQTVLEPGGSKPAAQLVHDFLGRDYSFDAFQAWLERS